jgi:exoribonuclease R
VPKQELEVNKMVAEFMVFGMALLLASLTCIANIAVAEKIHQSYPSTALLRRHPFPRAASFQELLK